MYRVASDPLIWEQHPARSRWEWDEFPAFFQESLTLMQLMGLTERITGYTFYIWLFILAYLLINSISSARCVIRAFVAAFEDGRQARIAFLRGPVGHA